MNDENSYIPKEKKSYVMYKSWNLIFLKMSDEDAGKLIKAICLYQNGEESILENPIAGAILSMMIDSFRSDNEKYEETCRKNSANGKKGGRGRHYPKPTESDRLRPQAKKADIDNDMDMDTDNDMDMDSDTDTETDTDIDPPASGSASVFYSESDEDFSAFQDMCRKENIQASGDQIENYLHEMNRKNWTDAGGQAVRNVGGHFRDWIKRHPDDSDDRKPKAEPVKVPVKASGNGNVKAEKPQRNDDEEENDLLEEAKIIEQLKEKLKPLFSKTLYMFPAEYSKFMFNSYLKSIISKIGLQVQEKQCATSQHDCFFTVAELSDLIWQAQSESEE